MIHNLPLHNIWISLVRLGRNVHFSRGGFLIGDEDEIILKEVFEPEVTPKVAGNKEIEAKESDSEEESGIRASSQVLRDFSVRSESRSSQSSYSEYL